MPSRSSREVDDDILEDIPVLPDIISMIAQTLDGGPFDYLGKTQKNKIHIKNLLYEDYSQHVNFYANRKSSARTRTVSSCKH